MSWTQGELDEQFKVLMTRFPGLKARRDLRWAVITRLLAEERLCVVNAGGLLRIVPMVTISLPPKLQPQQAPCQNGNAHPKQGD